MIIREFHEFLCPSAQRPQDIARRERAMARWRCENVVISATLRGNSFGPVVHGLSLKAAWGGREHYLIGNRRLSVDDDNYLVLNCGTRYSSVADDSAPVDSFSVFFRPALVSGVVSALEVPPDLALQERGRGGLRGPWFGEHLRPHDATITPLLLRIRSRVDAGCDDEEWLEEQLQELLMRIVEAEYRLRLGSGDILQVQSSTRDELLRRVRTAADFIHSNYTRPISLDDMAAAANLSKFYLVRLFRQVFGITPHAYLRRKRLLVARRMIEPSDTGLAEVADVVGFGSRSAMFRQLRQQFGVAGRALRRGSAGSRCQTVGMQ